MINYSITVLNIVFTTILILYESDFQNQRVLRMSQQILAVSHRAKLLIIRDDEQPLFGFNVLKHLNQSKTCREGGSQQKTIEI